MFIGDSENPCTAGLVAGSFPNRKALAGTYAVGRKVLRCHVRREVGTLVQSR